MKKSAQRYVVRKTEVLIDLLKDLRDLPRWTSVLLKAQIPTTLFPTCILLIAVKKEYSKERVTKELSTQLMIMP